MTKDPLSLRPSDSLSDVQKLFDKNRIHHIPICDEDHKLVGLITTYDLWKINKDHDNYENIKIEDVMTKKLAKIASNDKVGTAAEIFLDNRIHALPVVDDGKLVGIVTSFDILLYEFRKEYDKPILFEDVYSRGIATTK
jgi:CBS domain-containing protein